MKMTVKPKRNIIVFILLIAIFGCSRSADLPTPDKIGEKERTKQISGKHAAQVVDKLHGRPVAADTNAIAEYGRDKKDLLFISNYRNQTEAQKAFDSMIENIASAKRG
jgi:hypothetical protein